MRKLRVCLLIQNAYKTSGKTCRDEDSSEDASDGEESEAHVLTSVLAKDLKHKAKIPPRAKDLKHKAIKPLMGKDLQHKAKNPLRAKDLKRKAKEILRAKNLKHKAIKLLR